ncbi:hypothetical protein [Pedobacter sp. NJ-S-72]
MKTKNKKQKLILMPALLLLCMASCKKQEADSAIPDIEMNANKTGVSAISAANFKVIGYLPSWAGEVSQVQFSKLTHVLTMPSSFLLLLVAFNHWRTHQNFKAWFLPRTLRM